jgi:hypothetical protein
MFLAVIACVVAFFTVLFMTVIDLFHVVIPVLKKNLQSRIHDRCQSVA